MSEDRAPILLTPGPLTTNIKVRRAMLRDWGSRDEAFIALTAELRACLLSVVHGEKSHVAVPLQGSGTFIVEAAIGALVRPADKLLVLANGAYGERIAKIAGRLGRAVQILRWPENEAIECAAVDAALRDDPEISVVAMVHCETTTGLENPLAAIAETVRAAGCSLVVDAMSSFGALPIDVRSTPIAAILASSNKCLEGPPGIGFAVVEKSRLEAAKGVSASLSLDLYEQWQGFEENGQWRFTPPVQVVAATVEALRLLEAEGGAPGRLRRYRAHYDILLQGMRRLGFRLFLEERLQAPIIATFLPPEGAPFQFDTFYAALAARGFLIYPGKLTRAETFRIGCIGALNQTDFEQLIQAVAAISRPQDAGGAVYG